MVGRHLLNVQQVGGVKILHYISLVQCHWLHIWPRGVGVRKNVFFPPPDPPPQTMYCSMISDYLSIQLPIHVSIKSSGTYSWSLRLLQHLCTTYAIVDYSMVIIHDVGPAVQLLRGPFWPATFYIQEPS